MERKRAKEIRRETGKDLETIDDRLIDRQTDIYMHTDRRRTVVSMKKRNRGKTK